MPRGYRGAFIAIGLALCASLAQSQDQQSPTLEREPVAEHGQQEGATTSQQDSAPEQRQPIDYSPFSERIEGAIRDLVSEEDQEASQRQEQREIAELEAQQDVAFWTEGMFWASVAAVVVTFVGVVLIGFTLHHTRRAADYARDMVWEAEKTTDAALRTVQAERAWISFSGIQTSIEDDGTVGFAVKWINSGRSPALDLQTAIASKIILHGEERTTTHVFSPEHDLERRSTPFGPNMERTTHFALYGPDDAQRWESGAIRLIVYSYVGYRDFYSEEPRHTEFCGEVVFWGFNRRPDGGEDIHTIVKPYGQQNTGS